MLDNSAPTSTRLLPDTAAEALAAWKAGRPLHSVYMGHGVCRQQAVHAHAFRLIEHLLAEGVHVVPDQFETFKAHCEAIEGREDLSKHELEAAESLAFVALHRGWARFVREFPIDHRQEIIRES